MNESASKKLKVSVVVTVLNEATSIHELLAALAAQTYAASEIVITDGGSKDGTFELLQKWQQSHPELKLQLKQVKGNRSVGRNVAIEMANSQVIAMTDAGCQPHSRWLEELVKTYYECSANVVAGYYDGRSTSAFQAAVIPYALVMPDRIHGPFLPATRSMLIEKKWWSKVGRFDERLSDNEDYAFAHQLLKQGATLAFAQRAVVTWFPPKSIAAYFWMIFRFARGDMFAGIVRPKVLSVFGRYLFVALALGILEMIVSWNVLAFIGLLSFAIYSWWAILKNYKYAKQGWWWLPLLQYLADAAVMFGSINGVLNRLKTK